MGQELYHYSRLPATSDSVLVRSRHLLNRIGRRCRKYEIMITKDREKVKLGSLIRLYEKICRKAVSGQGVKFFMRYRLENLDSPDEEFAYAMERLFAAKPEQVLAYIHGQPDSIRTLLLDDIVWGFLNNRIYGAQNPYDLEESPSGRLEKPPPEILNKNTYRGIFFDLNNRMGKVNLKYPEEVGYILKSSYKFLSTWGNEY